MTRFGGENKEYFDDLNFMDQENKIEEVKPVAQSLPGRRRRTLNSNLGLF